MNLKELVKICISLIQESRRRGPRNYGADSYQLDVGGTPNPHDSRKSNRGVKPGFKKGKPKPTKPLYNVARPISPLMPPGSNPNDGYGQS